MHTPHTYTCPHARVKTMAMSPHTCVCACLMHTPTCTHAPSQLFSTCVHTQLLYAHPNTCSTRRASHPAYANAKCTHTCSNPPTLHRPAHALMWAAHTHIVPGKCPWGSVWGVGRWADRGSHLSCLPAWACVCAAVPSPPSAGRGQEEEQGGGGRPQWP